MNNVAIHVKLIIVAAIWGFGWPAGRVVATELPPIGSAWVRYVMVVIMFLAYLKWSNQWILPSKTQWKHVAWIGLFSTFVYQSMFMYGMRYTAAGDASLMITFNPLFTAFLAVLFLGERMSWRLFGGLVLAFAGVAVLFLASPNTDIPEMERWIGNAFIAGAAFAWAASTIIMKRVMTDIPEDAEAPLSPLHLTVWSSVIGLLILTPWAGIEALEANWTMPSVEAWAGILFLAVFSTVMAYVWFAEGIRVIGAGPSAFYIYLVPPFGILGGWLLLNEQLGTSLVVAFALIVGGVLLAQSKQTPTEQAS
ncbi:MAG TPA: DMT family transporter [Candidatus Poseidoniales archaeon]|nr:MAG TPA: DMT family transporter [Candidatus Poseidoniales archaeon]HII19799.1 DMT family transporter [Poseidonia sp.]|tara:strand:+ start:2143 stop:3066 length:924 start_codon:yes stop_codon:yes gene_type:complete